MIYDESIEDEGGREMANPRYLTKSRFTLAMECPTKLFYTGKSAYANQDLDDSFLLSLAEGGFQVGELAKCYFPYGHEIKTLEHKKALQETNALLRMEHVTIYEAAVAYKNLFIRVDILVRNGEKIQLYEVKAKSFDPRESRQFINKNGTLRSDWAPYLHDVAFQKYVINRAFPQYEVAAHLMLADKSALCPTDGLNQKFLLVKDSSGRTSVSISNTLSKADLTPPILCAINVDTECEMIFNGMYGLNGNAMGFSHMIALFANHYMTDTKIPATIAKKCSECEFYTKELDEENGLLDGRKECWKECLGWKDDDFGTPTVLDVWQFRRKDTLIEAGIIKMDEISKSDIRPRTDGKPGLSPSERQWLQIEKSKNNDHSMWLDTENLKREMSSWAFPLHFIDFETTMVAIPFHAGMRPYEGIAFQFSHHIVYQDGTVEHAGEYLNTRRGMFPNYEFIRALKSQLEHDGGSIFRYSYHENTYLNIIYRQLKKDPRKISDREELCRFIRTITQSKKDYSEHWVGERNMVDMCEIVKRYYYDPATNGSNSIKHVLPAILNRSTFLQKKYSQPLYGAEGGIKSLNFKNWQWVRVENGQVNDPYTLLPKLFQDASDKDIKILSSDDELREGGAALTAYARMQFEEMSDYEREEIQRALLKYCELDTLAMVMIYEGWKDFCSVLSI